MTPWKDKDGNQRENRDYVVSCHDQRAGSLYPFMKTAKFIGHNDEQRRFGNCQETRGILVPGRVYEIERVQTHSWHTKLHLVDIKPGKGFNKVSFGEIQERKDS